MKIFKKSILALTGCSSGVSTVTGVFADVAIDLNLTDSNITIGRRFIVKVRDLFKSIYRKSLIVVFSILFVGCGGGSTPPPEDSDPIIKTGYFIDSAVKGISYTTGTTTGTTDIDGKFIYTSNDTDITFKIGNITLANFNLSNINTDGKVLPTDIAQVDRNNTSDIKVLKVLRFLQSLDSDGNSSNGIDINSTTTSSLTQTINILDTNVTISTLTTILNNINIPMISEAQAKEHFENKLNDSFSFDIDTVAPNIATLTTDINQTLTLTTQIEVNGEVGAKIFINGIDTNQTIGINGKTIITLDTNATVDNNNIFNIVLKDSKNNQSDEFSFTITKQNNTPIATFTTLSVREDINKTATLTATDIDTAIDSLTFLKVTDPSHGTISLETNGTFTYSPNLNYNGSDSFTYKVNDGTIDSAIQTVTITINNTPIATFTTLAVIEDINKIATLTATDIQNDTLTFIKVTDPSQGTISLETNGTFTYSPNLNYYGNDSFTYKVNDGTVDSATQTVTITISNVNDTPIATFTTLAVIEDINKTATLTATDLDNSDTLTFIKVTDPSQGTISLETNGIFTYSPNLNYYGNDSFTYKVNDGTIDSAIQTVTITISSVNDTPVINSTYSDFSLEEDNGTTSYDINISDIDGDSLTLTVESNNTSILTVTQNWTNTLLQADYTGQILDFNLTTVTDAFGIVKITITVDDADKNDTTSFDINVTDEPEPILYNGTTYYEVTSPHTQKVWLDRNLGASMICTKSRDDVGEGFDDASYTTSQENCFGDYYQWGRDYDGHQESNSTITATLATDINLTTQQNIVDNNGSFIITDLSPFEWLDVDIDDNGSLRSANWSKTDGTSVCPIGFRVPTKTELTAETIGLSGDDDVQNRDDAFNSFLKLPSSGFRYFGNGDMSSKGSRAYIWAGSIDDGDSHRLNIRDNDATWDPILRSIGHVVRCLKD